MEEEQHRVVAIAVADDDPLIDAADRCRRSMPPIETKLAWSALSGVVSANWRALRAFMNESRRSS